MFQDPILEADSYICISERRRAALCAQPLAFLCDLLPEASAGRILNCLSAGGFVVVGELVGLSVTVLRRELRNMGLIQANEIISTLEGLGLYTRDRLVVLLAAARVRRGVFSQGVKVEMRRRDSENTDED